MRYFANPSTQRVRDAMTAGDIGCIATPAQGNRLPDGAKWCADNGVYGAGWPGFHKWWQWLKTYNLEQRSRCRFAVAPDVVADAARTLRRADICLPLMRRSGYRAAFAAQDGQESLDVPWDDFDVLFIGGSTDWKLGPHARALVTEAKARGKRVHMGRVNSERRYRYALAIGCDSVDGTYLTYGPDVLLPAVLAWTRNRHQQALEMM